METEYEIYYSIKAILSWILHIRNLRKLLFLSDITKYYSTVWRFYEHLSLN